MDKNLEASTKNLSMLFEKREGIEIPIYQRSYSWTKENAETLINDLFESYENENHLQYFLGNIIIKEKGKDDVIVDGQQRITTLTIIFFAMGKVVNESNWDIKDKKHYLNLLKNYIYKNVKNMNDEDFSLKLTSSIKNEKLEGFMNNVNPYNDEILEDDGSYYYVNFNCIFSILTKYLLTPEIFNNFFSWFTEKVVLVQIELPECMDEQKIFESINAEGVVLTSVDLIKNFIYSKIERIAHDDEKEKLTKIVEDVFEKTIPKLGEQTKLGEKLFSSYLSFIKSMANKEKDKELYKKFKNEFKNKDDFQLNIYELEKFANLYEKIQNYEVKYIDSLFSVSFHQVRSVLSGVLFPIFYFIFGDLIKKDEKLDDNKIFKNFIIKYAQYKTIRIIEGKTDKNHNRFFIETLLPKLKNKFKNKVNVESVEKIISTFFNSISSKMKDDVSSIASFDKNYLKNIWFKHSFYKKLSSEEILGVLLRIEFTKKCENDEKISFEMFEKWEVEHIFPQNPESNSIWMKIIDNKIKNENIDIDEDAIIFSKCHKWGNLTILHSNDNKRISNADFVIKKIELNNSLFRINNYFKGINDWDFSSIDKRENEMWNDIWETIKDYEKSFTTKDLISINEQ